MKENDLSVSGPAPFPARNAETDRTIGEVWGALQTVVDPELHAGIVDLGLVYGVEAKDGRIAIRMTLTSPACPYGPYLLHQVKTAAKTVSGVCDAVVELVWDPPWSPALMNEELRLNLGFDV